MRAPTIKVAIIPADIQMPIQFTEIENTLEAKQKLVDGYIEAIRLRENAHGMVAMDMYCNEEFLYRDDLGENLRAMALYMYSFLSVNELRGDMVLIGGVDEEGDDIGLTEAQQDFIRRTFDRA